MELDVEAATSRAASGGEEGELFSLPVGKKRGDLKRLKIGRDHVCPSFFGHLFGSVNNIFEIAKNRTNFELSKELAVEAATSRNAARKNAPLANFLFNLQTPKLTSFRPFCSDTFALALFDHF